MQASTYQTRQCYLVCSSSAVLQVTKDKSEAGKAQGVQGSQLCQEHSPTPKGWQEELCVTPTCTQFLQMQWL